MSISAMIKAIYANVGRSGSLGTNVYRAAAADPQNVQQTLFTVAGGLVLVTGFYGVRTVIQAGGASTIQFRFSVGPTVLDSGATVITADAVGTIYSITGNVNDPALQGIAGLPIFGSMMGSQTVGSVQQKGIVLPAGNIQVIMTAAAGTGSTRYVLSYIPIDIAANVVAA